MSVTDLDHIYVETRHFEKTLAFWRALGFTPAAKWGEGDHQACRLQAGAASVVLAGVGPHHHPQSPTAHLAIEDAEALNAQLLDSENVEVVTPLADTHWGTRWIRVRDPDGNLHSLEVVSKES